MPEPRDDWRANAACGPEDTELFFQDNDQAAVEKAKNMCLGCPVRKQCLDFAVDARINVGIFGGKTARQRQRIRGLM